MRSNVTENKSSQFRHSHYEVGEANALSDRSSLAKRKTNDAIQQRHRRSQHTLPTTRTPLPLSIIAAVNTEGGKDAETRYSTLGFVVFVNGSPIHWNT
eukprot:IDg21592t1